jgi:uncharacterized membrane protein
MSIMAEYHTLVALVFDSSQAAHDALRTMREFDRNDEAIHIVDAAFASKTENGRVRIEQTNDVTAGAGFLSGGVLGVIIGAVLAGPAGAAVGALSGGVLTGLYTGLRDSGIENDILDYVGEDLRPGQSALVLLYDGMLSEQMLQALSAQNARLHHTTLDGEVHSRIAAALGGEAIATREPVEYDLPPLREDREAGIDRPYDVGGVGSVAAANTGAGVGLGVAAPTIMEQDEHIHRTDDDPDRIPDGDRMPTAAVPPAAGIHAEQAMLAGTRLEEEERRAREAGLDPDRPRDDEGNWSNNPTNDVPLR